MEYNPEQFGTRMDGAVRRVNEVSSSNLEAQISDLTALVRQMVVGQRKYDLYFNHYNLGWKDHLNSRYGYQEVPQHGYQPQAFNRHPPSPPQSQSSNSGMSLDEIVKALVTNTQQFQQETRTSIQTLGNQINQLATTVSKLEAQGSGRLHSQTDVNPRENVSSMTLRKVNEISSSSPIIPEVETKSEEDELEQTSKNPAKVISNPFPLPFSNVVPHPFPSRLASFIKEESVRCKDPGMFTLPCVIGNKGIERAIRYLGASFDVMPYFLYQFLNLDPMKKTLR